MPTATVRVADVRLDPLRRDRLRRWLISLEVLAVHDGALPAGAAQLSLLVHSPARDFREADILGNRYVLTLPGSANPLPDEPYTGEFSVAPVGPPLPA